MLSVSRAVARGGPLAEVLDQIAREAARVVGARSASILLLRAPDRLTLAASYGLSADYGERLERAPKRLVRGQGPSGLAIEREAPVVFEDTSADPGFAPWRELADREGYRSMVSIPLKVDGATLGTLNAYRARAGAWPERSVRLLAFFAEHAASAIRTAQLIDGQSRQLGALERLVRGLREQTHEHANRIHAIGGLLALGDVEGARAFVSNLEQAVLSPYGSVTERLGHTTLAGLVLAEMSIARQRGATLELDEASALRELPGGLGDAEAVTIVGNLIDNALDAVAELPRDLRRVRLSIRDGPADVVFRIHNPGPGIPPEERALLLRAGHTTKGGHAGLGLAIVADTVASLSGRLTLEDSESGTTFVVRIPRD